MNNTFAYSNDNKRYHTLSYHFGQIFGRRMTKLALNTGCTCPNRDGSKGVGGCTFCSQAGGAIHKTTSPLAEQYACERARFAKKWPNTGFIAYFQSFSNTYLPLERLRLLVEEALALPRIGGLAIATRADCITPEIADYLAEIAQRTWLSVELGLQSIHDETALRINRCHTYSEFLQGYELLKSRGVNICVHLINGLPGETCEMMLESARAVAALRPHSVKLHMLHILKDTALAREYAAKPFRILTRDEYVGIVCDQLALLPPEIVIQRVTGDPLKSELIEPRWTTDKLRARNAIDLELVRRGIFQGDYFGADAAYIAK